MSKGTPKVKAINVVWLKRDLRTQDHAPLKAAESSGLPYIILYLFEPQFINYPDTSIRHLQFVYHSIKRMNESLSAHKRKVEILHGNALEVFSYLMRIFNIQQVFSHQESGIEVTWSRDREVRSLFHQEGITWIEYQRDGIVRGITDRQGWDKQWFVTMHQPMVVNTFSDSHMDALSKHPFVLPADLKKTLQNYPSEYQPAGEHYAWKYLRSFTDRRGFTYNKHISKPSESRQSCGRISPYLAWGNLSIKQAYQHIKHHDNYQNYKRPFGAMLTRLKWHCHFIQKFEVECTYETICINRGYESLPHQSAPSILQAWKRGQTGYPLVDACMRCVTTTGWINFRMRAMLVSFLCHHLDQNWKDGVYHLAQQFLDYEPGIHYPQFQMQAGTTGINTVRIYNPVKQSTEHDPEGQFIKKWVPELANVSAQHVHEPWKMTEMDQSFCGVTIGQHYPAPVVDLQESGKRARAKIWGHRKEASVKKESKRILATHTRASNRMP